MKTFQQKLDFVANFCTRRAGTNNSASTRELCNCIEHDEGERLLAHLVRRAHKNPKLEQGVRLMFVVSYLNEAAKKFGVTPLPVISSSVLP